MSFSELFSYCKSSTAVRLLSEVVVELQSELLLSSPLSGVSELLSELLSELATARIFRMKLILTHRLAIDG